MITLTKAPEAEAFSRLEGNPFDRNDPPRTNLYRCGITIRNQIEDLNFESAFKIGNYVIMPDHVHILWIVKEWLPKQLGYYIGLFKSRCSKIWHEEYCPDSEISIFNPKFNDRIAFDDEMTARFSNYINENPARRLMVMKYPQLFDRVQKIRVLNYEMDVYGNFQLLKHPLIAAAIVSSRYTPQERAEYERQWEMVIRGGGVFVSPFISKPEQALMHRILEEGGSIIRIIPDGMGPKYKPAKEDFNLCVQGRCLHIGMPRQSMHTEDLHRSKCLELNDIARWIASHPTDTFAIINAKSQIR